MIWQLDACGLAAAYRKGETNPSEAVAECLSRIDRIDGEINAFVAMSRTAEDEARASAERIRAGTPRGPLDGIPIAVKDNLGVAGLPVTWGSRAFASRLCDADELPVRRLREAGAIVLGKTNTPEFSVEGYTANALFGVTRNPWNTDLTPGGSSGGSVAAVAAGLVPAAIGTDGGGSIRRPAAYTGLFGLKPSTGRVARGGGLPQLLLDFEVVGPLTRTVRDLRMLYTALAGPVRSDPRSRRGFQGRPPDRQKLSILYVERFGDAPCDPSILRSCAHVVERLGDQGHHVAHGALPFDLSGLNAFWGTIAQVSLARLRRSDDRVAGNAGSHYLAMADEGDDVSATDFLAGLDAVDALRSAVSNAFADWDLIMTPACAAMPWAADKPFPETIDGEKVGPRGHAVYTGWVNACGHPAIALPTDPSPEGIPIGVQIVGDLGTEPLLLATAEAYEETMEAQGWPELALQGACPSDVVRSA